MADSTQQSRTEQATPRRLERAREEGQVAYSTDFTTATVLFVASLVLAIFSDYFLGNLASSFSRVIRSISQLGAERPNWSLVATNFITDFFALLAPIALVVTLTSLLVAGLMTGFKTSPKAFKFDVDRAHPKHGLKKIFSVRSLVRSLVAIFKLLLLIVVTAAFVYWRQYEFLVSSNSPEMLVRAGWSLCIHLCLAVSSMLLVMGLIDLLFQKWKHLQDLRMSLQEVRDEFRETEGDPHLRARLKKLQREISQRRMLQDVRDATVVVTNPTHYAVALKYQRDKMATPVVVAKGVDKMAHKIIAIAREHQVTIVERRKLARAMFHSVKVGQEIPIDLFQAVAEVIAYVYQLKRAAA